MAMRRAGRLLGPVRKPSSRATWRAVCVYGSRSTMPCVPSWARRSSAALLVTVCFAGWSRASKKPGCDLGAGFGAAAAVPGSKGTMATHMVTEAAMVSDLETFTKAPYVEWSGLHRASSLPRRIEAGQHDGALYLALTGRVR